jgi:hypothetical protein
VLLDSTAEGVKVAVLPVSATVPVTEVLPACKVKVVVLMVEGFIASLKVALIELFTATPVWLFAGFVEATVGGVVSAPEAVVKDQL